MSLYVPTIEYPRNMYSMQALTGGPVIWLPNPETDSGKGTVQTLVNSGRNASGVVTAQKIGRDQNKTEMKWAFLNKEDWESLLQFWDTNFFFNFSYYSPVSNTRITRKFYVGDRTWRPFAIDDKGNPVAYVDCSANVIDTGEGS